MHGNMKTSSPSTKVVLSFGDVKHVENNSKLSLDPPNPVLRAPKWMTNTRISREMMIEELQVRKVVAGSIYRSFSVEECGN